MLKTNSTTLRKVVQADLNQQPRANACWTAQLLSAFEGLRVCESYVRAVQTGCAVSMQDFTTDLEHRMRGVWRYTEVVDPTMHDNKLATYHSWFALPFSSNPCNPCNPFSSNVHVPITVPRYLHLDLPKHVLRNVSRFQLRAHTLRVEAAAWLEGSSQVCGQCPGDKSPE
jgi:hypothetical protein